MNQRRLPLEKLLTQFLKWFRQGAARRDDRPEIRVDTTLNEHLVVAKRAGQPFVGRRSAVDFADGATRLPGGGGFNHTPQQLLLQLLAPTGAQDIA